MPEIEFELENDNNEMLNVIIIHGEYAFLLSFSPLQFKKEKTHPANTKLDLYVMKTLPYTPTPHHCEKQQFYKLEDTNTE